MIDFLSTDGCDDVVTWEAEFGASIHGSLVNIKIAAQGGWL
jgi:hypothetical protein